MKLLESQFGVIIYRKEFILCNYYVDKNGQHVILDNASISSFPNQKKLQHVILGSQGGSLYKNILIAFHSSFSIAEQLEYIKSFTNQGITISNYSSTILAYFCAHENLEDRVLEFTALEEKNNTLTLSLVHPSNKVSVLIKTLNVSNKSTQEAFIIQVASIKNRIKPGTQLLTIGSFTKLNGIVLKASKLLQNLPYQQPDNFPAQEPTALYTKIFKGLWKASYNIEIQDAPSLKSRTESKIKSKTKTTKKPTSTKVSKPKTFELDVANKDAIPLTKYLQINGDSKTLSKHSQALIVSLWDALERTSNLPVIRASNIFVYEVPLSVWDKAIDNTKSYKIFFKEYYVGYPKNKEKLFSELDTLLMACYDKIAYQQFLDKNKE